ncbi:TerB family tellurite resistance protein [Pedobacter panaciterrae]|uniref:TerB family tellurite resistance protein n=1 Tax=Pedobacter panaciterrae TaxID=363849 RepID=A0ABU8NJM7_9SPHI
MNRAIKSIRTGVLLLIVLAFGMSGNGFAQSQEAQQLLLNVEKLSQLKNILSDMKRGYEVVSQGYKAVTGIAKGNFSLHEVFLDGLMLVSPEVRKYRKVGDILTYQKRLVSEYKSAFSRFRSAGTFSFSELEYLGSVYSDLLRASLDNLDELAMVITAGKLRMSDEERLKAIDRIFLETEDKLLFLRDFNKHALQLSGQRERQKIEMDGLSGWYK